MRLLELQPTSTVRRRDYTKGRLFQIVCLLRSPQPWTDPENAYIRLLQSCSTLKAVTEGKQVHSHIVKHGVKPNGRSWVLLISMYANCGCFTEAHDLLRCRPRMSDAWSAVIAAYIARGNLTGALYTFSEMVQEGVSANETSIVLTLNACGNLVALTDGLQLHDYIVRNGHESNLTVHNSLLQMYCKCHALQFADRVFEGMEQKNEDSWTAIIMGYADEKIDKRAIAFFQQMLKAGISPNRDILLNILRSCANAGILDLGRDVHQQIRSSGLSDDTLLSNLLIVTYSRCGSIKEACRVFYRIPRKDITSWNAMLEAHNHHALYKDAFRIFDRLKQQVTKPDIVTIFIMIDVCTNLRNLDRGREVHHYFIKRKIRSNTSLFSKVIDMYIKCDGLQEARQFFNGLRRRDTTVFNTMINGYVQFQLGKEAFELFQLMKKDGIRPNDLTLTILRNVLPMLQHTKFSKICLRALAKPTICNVPPSHAHRAKLQLGIVTGNISDESLGCLASNLHHL